MLAHERSLRIVSRVPRLPPLALEYNPQLSTKSYKANGSMCVVFDYYYCYYIIFHFIFLFFSYYARCIYSSNKSIAVATRCAFQENPKIEQANEKKKTHIVEQSKGGLGIYFYLFFIYFFFVLLLW